MASGRKTEVYTDGSCSGNGQPNASAGIGVYFGDNHPLNVSRPVYGRATSSVAEIEAATEAIKVAKKGGVRELKINTDSDFLIKSANDWMPKWKENGWRNSTGAPVKNRHEFQNLDRALQGPVQVDWHYVPAHSGIPGNERADRLAKTGAAAHRQQQNNKKK